MGIDGRAYALLGKEVIDWTPPGDGGADDAAPPARAAKKKPKKPRVTGVWRVGVEYDEHEDGTTWGERFQSFLDSPHAATAIGLVVGGWDGLYDGDSEGGAAAVVEQLVAARKRLPALRAVFLGDITQEESEISWINQTDVAPLLNAYPKLEEFQVRGGNGLSLGTLRHKALRKLVVEAGGLPAAVVREVGKARLPALEHLELWLGTRNYGGDSTADDVAPILAGKGLPKLKYLGLRNSDITDAIARAVVRAPILDRIEVLDLSMGTLTDDGAAALLLEEAVEKLKRLKRINLDHHYVSDWVMEKLTEAGLKVEAGEEAEAHLWGGEIHRYTAVGE